MRGDHQLWNHAAGHRRAVASRVGVCCDGWYAMLLLYTSFTCHLHNTITHSRTHNIHIQTQTHTCLTKHLSSLTTRCRGAQNQGKRQQSKGGLSSVQNSTPIRYGGLFSHFLFLTFLVLSAYIFYSIYFSVLLSYYYVYVFAFHSVAIILLT